MERYTLYRGCSFEELLSRLLSREPAGETPKGCAVLAEMGKGDSLVQEALGRATEAVAKGSASLVYGDWIEQTAEGWLPMRTIDCSEGALRDDFDFGHVVVVSEQLLRDFLGTVAVGSEGSLFYAFTLYARRWGSLLRMAEPLMRKALVEVQPSEGVEAQFEYVMAEQRRRQQVREGLCREHLRAVGGLLCSQFRIQNSEFRNSDGALASVIIPVFNRKTTIADAIGSALSQQTDFRYNVIVVDNFSTDGTSDVIDALAADNRVVHLKPSERSYGIGGCWQLAIDDERCGRYAVQLDSDDLYASTDVLQKIVDKFRQTGAAAVIGSYKLVDFDLNPLPPGVIDHREWSGDNGMNNALRINGFGAPRAFLRDVVRQVGFPNVSYGEDYAMCLRVSAEWRVERIYDVLYLCRRWGGNSDSKLTRERQNANNLYKDSVRTRELLRRKQQAKQEDNAAVSQEELKDFFDHQLHAWPEVAARVGGIDEVVETKELLTPHCSLLAQFNPARIGSTGAKVDKQSISERPCFLCPSNQPAEQWRSRATDNLWLCINPYPILRYHLTLPTREHRRQELLPMLGSMLSLAEAWPDMIVFYNGPGCGASAPDHAHLQAGLGSNVPLRRDWRSLQKSLVPIEPETRESEEGLYLMEGYAVPVVVAKGGTAEEAEELTRRAVAALPVQGYEWEPRMNVIAWTEARAPHSTGWIVCIIPREKLRPECYFKQGEEQRVISPGALDMAGLIIAPREDDFNRLTASEARGILNEVALNSCALARAMRRLRGQKEDESNPVLSVGIVEAERVTVAINNEQLTLSNEGGRVVMGEQKYFSLLLEPEGAWTIDNVVIGKQFHWERQERQTFEGALWVVPRGERLQVINCVRLEAYLHSVIASEMKATASLEYLKASAIASRSWLLAQLRGTRYEVQGTGELSFTDSSAHLLFDVCADDHCQRYQGLVRAENANVDKAVDETRGVVLLYDGEVCDARFSKCCGGRTEEFSACWQDVDLPYLRSLPDGGECGELSSEEAMREWAESSPTACCNTSDEAVLSQVLNDYDRETRNFFRWQVELSQGELQELLRRKMGLDLGEIKDLVPLQRGRGGRISSLKIVGTRGEQVIGKELTIRRALSETHLLSAAFIVEEKDLRDGIPHSFILKGAGWGHGVGMCQIGAARMASEGASAEEILRHYFGSEVEIRRL